MNVARLYQYWSFLENKPMGRWLFHRVLAFINPYTGSLKAKVCVLSKGYCRIELNDRRAIRNHLNSIHAIALTNLGEFTSGLALLSLFTDNLRGIPVDIHIEFLKKARGKLVAECTTDIADFTTEILHTVTAEIRDQEGDIVARTRVMWKLAYKVENT